MATFNGVVRGGSLNLRSSCSTNSTKLASIPNSANLSVSTVSGYDDWFETNYNESHGYVVAQYVSVASETTCVVNTSSGSLNIRKTPSTSATVLYTAAKGSTLYLLEGNPGSGWCRVSGSSGTGWASGQYLSAGSESGGAVGGDLTVEQYIENLESYCNNGWKYGSGYNASSKTIDCAWYPYKARNEQGAHGCTTEYNSYLSEKGTISSLGGYDSLVRGMEIFQPNSDDSSVKEHMGVYAGKVELNGTLQHAVYQSCSSHNTIDTKYNNGVSGDSGPNVTGMNNKWKYWGWSKYVKHD